MRTHLQKFLPRRSDHNLTRGLEQKVSLSQRGMCFKPTFEFLESANLQTSFVNVKRIRTPFEQSGAVVRKEGTVHPKSASNSNHRMFQIELRDEFCALVLSSGSVRLFCTYDCMFVHGSRPPSNHSVLNQCKIHECSIQHTDPSVSQNKEPRFIFKIHCPKLLVSNQTRY